jgi:signal transduction histidine kinase
MLKLRYKLALFNVLSKAAFGLLFVILMPVLLERINTIQTDNELIAKREQVIDLIAEWGLEIMPGTYDATFGSYNILKEEYISLEPVADTLLWNFVEVAFRQVEDEIIEYRVLNYTFLIDGENYLLEIGKSMTSIRSTERNIRRLTIFLLVLFVVVTLLSDISYGARVVRPIEKIAERLHASANTLSYEQTENVSTTSEFAYLDLTISELMKKIRELFRKEKDITANISHELLTPIMVLRSRLENISMQSNLDEDTMMKIEDSLKTLHRLKTMVNSLLLIARVESHQYLRNETVRVHKLLDEIVQELIPMAEDKEIELVADFVGDNIYDNANHSLLFSMFYNVVNNAIKFTPPGGKVTVSAVSAKDGMVVSVADTGPGMDAVALERLFQRFRLGPQSKGQGSGIGLAIAKTIASFHNIRVEVKSTPGQGCTFFFIFPAKFTLSSFTQS